MGYTPDMIVADIVDSHPKAASVLLSFGLNCSECIVAWYETLEQGLAPHGIAAGDVIAKLDAEAPRPDHSRKGKKKKGQDDTADDDA